MKKSAAKNPPKWIKLTVFLSLQVENYKKVVWDAVQSFEHEFNVRHLYFARYTDLETSRVEISAHTGAEFRNIIEFAEKIPGVIRVSVAYRDSGSLAHAFAYQAVKKIAPFEKDLPEDNDFADVLHWMCNMRGMDYIREARLYSYRALVELHKLALESEKNLKAMRDFNAKARTTQIADDLVERLNLAGKRPKVDKTHGPAPRPKRKKSAPSAARKVFAGRVRKLYAPAR
jgi:hypothetical protein